MSSAARLPSPQEGDCDTLWGGLGCFCFRRECLLVRGCRAARPLAEPQAPWPHRVGKMGSRQPWVWGAFGNGGWPNSKQRQQQPASPEPLCSEGSQKEEGKGGRTAEVCLPHPSSHHQEAWLPPALSSSSKPAAVARPAPLGAPKPPPPAAAEQSWLATSDVWENKLQGN